MKSISSDYLKIILVLLSIHFAQSAFAAEKCALPHQLTDSSKKIHCLDKFEFSKKKYSNLNKPLNSLVLSKKCWSLAIPNEASCKNIIGFSANYSQLCFQQGAREENNKSALSMCEVNGCKCSLVIDANDIVDAKLFFSYAMGETDLVALNNPEKEAKENISNKSEDKNSQSEKNQSVTNAEKEKQAHQDLKLAQEAKAIEDIKAKAQQELKLAQEAKAREGAIFEASQKAQQELRQSQEAQAREAALEKLQQEEYEKEKQNAAAKARVLEEIKAEAYAKEKAILEGKAKAQADLKAEEIAKKQAEEQAKAQAIIDEKNRLAAAKSAAVLAKKNREQEIAEEKRKIAESQRKIEELKNKPLDIENTRSAFQLINPGERLTCITTVSENAVNGVSENRTIVDKSNPVFIEINDNTLKAYFLPLQGSSKVTYDGAKLNESTIKKKKDGRRYVINTFYKKGEMDHKIIFFREIDNLNKFISVLMQWDRFDFGIKKNQFADADSYGQNTAICQTKQDLLNMKSSNIEKSNPLPENEFPYFAIIRCYPKYQPQIKHLMFTNCFVGGRNITTDLEITNGKEYELYSGHSVQNQIANLGTVSQEGVKILLRKNFKISAQNAHDNYILNIAIYDAKTNDIIEQKSVSEYGAIEFRN